ncbi:acVLRF1 family peptidyl-tRNA hydrolase [Arthrobacter antioxidans]|uniref:acVLRF1 family peptidyl-tRNA hydrolase n=1 Tax=Arthrobacter antioxidans TaxID=2895818 RepID=UPI001FFE4B64|nr:acVLRF1 family peptidyl-tRNA hydrolase [Arthrobacter antioxidans]
MTPSRSVLVEAGRLEGWLARFEARNGPFSVHSAQAMPERADGSVTVTAVNGCIAVLTPPLPPGTLPGPGPEGAVRGSAEGAGPVLDLLPAVDPATTVGILLVRRGGYSVGVARDGGVVSSKTGTRYVQGRTAAGGWSQQRFARRRANQADALVEETAARAAALFGAHPPSCLQLGGDRTLATGALGEPVLSRFAGLPQVPFLTVPDPRFAVLKEAARTALAVRITVTDPPGESP